MPYFSHDSINFYHESRGTGIPLVFLHGLGGDIEQPFETLNGLEGFQIHAMEFRGHGNTQYDGDVSKLNFQSFTADFTAFLDHLGLEKVIVGGISMGSGISLNLAINHPDRVEKLILVRPAWLNEPLPEYLKLVHDMACVIEEKGVDDAIDYMTQSEGFKAMQKTTPEAAESLTGLWNSPTLAEFAPLLKYIPASAPFQSFEDLKKVIFPTLVIGTAEDPIHPLHFAKTISEHIPEAVFDETAPRYVFPEQYQKDVVRMVQGFLMNLSANRAEE